MNISDQMIRVVVVGLGAVSICACTGSPTKQSDVSTLLAPGTWTVLLAIANPHLEKNEQFEIVEDNGELYVTFIEKTAATTPDFHGVGERLKLRRIENGPIETWCAPAVLLSNGKEHVFVFDVSSDGKKLLVQEGHTETSSCDDRPIHGGRAHAEN